MKRLLLILFLILAFPISTWAAETFLKESNNAAGTGDKILKESNAAGGAILKEYSVTPLVLISGNNGTYSYVLYDGGSTYDPVVQVTGTGNTFENCTFYSINGLALDIDESCTITNCIIEGNTQDIDIAVGKTVTAKNNSLHHSTDATNNIGAGTYTDTNSIYAQDPLFRVDGSDFHIVAGSPCKDAGFDTGADTDLDGRVTPRGAGMDIGCYELGSSGGSIGMGMGLKGYCPYRWD